MFVTKIKFQVINAVNIKYILQYDLTHISLCPSEILLVLMSEWHSGWLRAGENLIILQVETGSLALRKVMMRGNALFTLAC